MNATRNRLRTRSRGLTAGACALAIVLLPALARAQDPPPSDHPADTLSSAAEAAAATDSAAPALTAPAPAPSAASTRRVRLSRESRNVVRSGPGDRYAIVGVYPKDASFPVIAKSGEWYNLRLSATETGWIHASLVREYDDFSDLEFRPNPRMYTRTGSFIASGYTGGYAFDRQSNSLVLGGRLGYYVFDRLQVEAGLGWTHVHRPSEIVESLFGLSLEAVDFDMLFYQLIATWELLPGRQMVPYVSGGVGSAIMQGETEPSFNVGAGTIVYLSKRTGVRWEVRDYSFRTGSDNARRTNHNIEFTLGGLLLF